MKRAVILFILILSAAASAGAQEFIQLWEADLTPNSKRVAVEEVMDDELITQVARPGIYVFRPSDAENKGAAVLILPSGGYSVLSYATGFQLAKWFNTTGVTAFVLKYRLPHSPDVIEPYKAPLQDTQRAMRIIRSKAQELGYDADRTGVMGASAGGHLAACLSTIGEDWYEPVDSIDELDFTPSFAILISPVISMSEDTHISSRDVLLGKNPSQEIIDALSCHLNVNANTPSTFIVHAGNDDVVSPMNSILYFTALLQQRIKGSSLQVYPEGGHSIRVRTNPGITQFWPVLAEKWLIENEIIK